MDPAEEFRTVTMKRFVAAERAESNGDPGPRIALWSHRDPVTLCGALVPARTGWADIERAFRGLADMFSECTDYEMDLVACEAIGDMGYTVGIERMTLKIRGEVQQVRLRTTHVWRREDGEWKIVHRHGDFGPEEDFQGPDQ
jgi:ketosteroid isomerase-like protein